MKLTESVVGVALFASLLVGCRTPATLGGRGLLPAQTADSKESWIYLESEDKDESGVYRCYDQDGAPRCVKAKLISPR